MTDQQILHFDDDNFQNDSNNKDDYDDDIEKLNEIFSKYKDDPDQNFVNVYYLTEILQAFGRNPTQKDAHKRILEFESNGKFEITIDDVLQILDEPWTLENNERDALRKALEKFDLHNDGYIDIEIFRRVMTTIGEPLSDEEVDRLIQLGFYKHTAKLRVDDLLDQLLAKNA